MKKILALLFVFLAAVSAFPIFAQEPDPAGSVASGEADAGKNEGEKDPLSTILAQARAQKPGALLAFCRYLIQEGQDSLSLEGISEEDQSTIDLLLPLVLQVNQAMELATTFLGDPDNHAGQFREMLRAVLADDIPESELAIEALGLIIQARHQAGELLRQRESLFSRMGQEVRQGSAGVGIRLAWSLIRAGASRSDTAVDPDGFFYDDDSARMRLRHMGAIISVNLRADDYQNAVIANVDGYRFRTGWAILMQKPFGWMATMAPAMRDAGVSADLFPEWTLMEAPEGLIALAPDGEGSAAVPQAAFFQGAVRTVTPIPAPPEAAKMRDAFFAAARRLHDGVMGDESIPFSLRQALKPVLMGTYSEIDPRDYFDNEFCRRLIEADYLEAHVRNLGPERLRELEEYRDSLARLEAGIDLFAVDLGDAGRLVAVNRPDLDVSVSETAGYNDKETGESVYRYQWRWERADSTLFHSPLPSRYLYALSILEKYDGRHRTRPLGVAEVTEVWHAVLGKLAAYRMGDSAASGDAGKWLEAVVMDARGRRDGTAGPLGWNFPLFVPVRDNEGDPVLLATLGGVVTSPDLSRFEAGDKRQAQDDWLDETAAVLATPGELALIFQQFFRYCSDSPLPEMPGLIGSHYGLSDTHQTVYESLDRRWVGRLIGDCDDLAEFYQELVERQGKLCHVMQLPSHAAAGYLEQAGDEGYEFIVLQTGPLLRFTDATREGAVEKAYRHFQEAGRGHFTLSAVPLLLRFADEDTRTPFVLSARIYWDRDYAEQMIAVQQYWHLHTFSAGVRAMEKMLESDREPGNIRELASLYERTGQYDLARALRQEELATVDQDDAMAILSILLEKAQLHDLERDREGALTALAAMEPLLDSLPRPQGEWVQSAWAALTARLGEPVRAWKRVGPQADRALANGGKPSESLMRTVTHLYERLAGNDGEEERMAEEGMRAFLDRAFSQGYFLEGDDYNKIHSRYYTLGRYAIARDREAGLTRLLHDGPYPDGPRNHAERDAAITDEDWAWFRLSPRLFLSIAFEMLDRDEYPERYDPMGASRYLEAIESSVNNAVRIGSNASGGSELSARTSIALAMIRGDLDAYAAAMEEVREKDYASLYNQSAVTFGQLGNLLPLEELPRWLEVFNRYFPGRQHYFKAAYAALEKGHYAHGISIGRAAAEFFASDPLFTEEAKALEEAAARMQSRRQPPSPETRAECEEISFIADTHARLAG